MESKRIYSNKICISTNSTCNLNCVYCYEKNKTYSDFNVEEAFIAINEQLSRKTEFGTKIKLHGGEPFIVFDKIRELCERVWDNSYPEYYHFHITTNGTLIHGEVQDWLYEKRNRITIKLSLDGNKYSHNINRTNSFDQIDLAFFVRTWPDIVVNMTITPATLPYLSENIKFLHSIGIHDVTSHFALMTDFECYHLEKVLYEQLLDLATFYLENTSIKPCHFFKPNIGDTMYEPLFNAACVRGQGTAYDYRTKKHYPCFMCFPVLAGEQISDELSRIDFSNTDILEQKCCLQCPFINICPTCYAENYITRGDVSRRDMKICSYQKIIIAVLFKYEYARLINKANPTSDEVQKMLAIQKWHREIESIINAI